MKFLLQYYSSEPLRLQLRRASIRALFGVVVVGLLWGVFLGGCWAGEVGEVEDPRALSIQSLLLEEHADLLVRDPVLVAGKFEKMSMSPYNYFRGTASFFFRDLSRAGTPSASYLGSALATEDPEAAEIMLLGDPHPENIGVYLPEDGTVTVDFNDFDGAHRGPFRLDIWRLSLGFDVLAGMGTRAGTLSAEFRANLPREIAGAYFDEIAALQRGASLGRIVPDRSRGAILDDLIRRAIEDGEDFEKLEDYSVVSKGTRTLRPAEFEREMESPGVIDDDLDEISQSERELLQTLLEKYIRTLEKPLPLEGFKVKGMARRLGAGVSSYPLLRYYILVEGFSAAIEDDWLIELKEARDAPTLPDTKLQSSPEFENNAHRIVAAQRMLQSTRVHDPLLGWAAHGGQSFRVRYRTAFQKGIRVARILDKLEDKKWTPEDLLFFAQTAGRMLADAHARPKTLKGNPTLPIIAAALKGKREALLKETIEVVARFGPETFKDHARLLKLLKTKGRLLGHRLSPTPMVPPR